MGTTNKDGPRNPVIVEKMKIRGMVIKKRSQAYLGRSRGDQGRLGCYLRDKTLRKRRGVSTWDPWSLTHTKGRPQGSSQSSSLRRPSAHTLRIHGHEKFEKV